MKKMKYLIVVLLLLVMSPRIVKAACTDADTARLSKLASQVKVTAEIQDKITNTYKIMVSGLTNDIAAYTINDKGETTVFDFGFAVNGVVTVENFSSTNRVVEIFGFVNDEICESLLRTISLNAPKYNAYADREECKGIDVTKFAMCDPNYQFDIKEQDFINRLNDYKKSLEQKPDEDKDDTDDVDVAKTSVIDDVIEFLKDYYLYIVGATVIIVAIVVIIVRNKKRGELV